MEDQSNMAEVGWGRGFIGRPTLRGRSDLSSDRAHYIRSGNIAIISSLENYLNEKEIFSYVLIGEIIEIKIKLLFVYKQYQD